MGEWTIVEWMIVEGWMIAGWTIVEEWTIVGWMIVGEWTIEEEWTIVDWMIVEEWTIGEWMTVEEWMIREVPGEEMNATVLRQVDGVIAIVTVTVMSVTVLHQVLGEEVVVMTVDVTTVIDQVVGEGVTETLGMVGVVVTVKTVTGEMAMVTALEEIVIVKLVIVTVVIVTVSVQAGEVMTVVVTETGMGGEGKEKSRGVTSGGGNHHLLELKVCSLAL